MITGAQYVEYAWPWFINARASRAMAAPVSRHRLLLNAAAVVIGNAKFVDAGVFPELFTCEIPWVASDHLVNSEEISRQQA